MSVELDVRHQTADADLSNNAFPQRVTPSRLEVFRQTNRAARNQMADALVELQGEGGARISIGADPPSGTPQ